MSQSNTEFSVPTQELYLLLFLGGVAAAMFLYAFTFSSAASLFPQLTAGFVLIGIALILLNQYLPEPIHTIVMGDASAFERDEFVQEDSEFEDTGDDNIPESTEWHWTDENVFTAILFSGYIVVSYLLGLLWATPLFVYAYARWFDEPRWVVWSLVGISFILAVGFWYFLNLPIDTGLIHELVGLE